MKIIAVIFPIFNGLEFTRKALENLKNTEKYIHPENLKIINIVIDDGSTDGSYEYIRSRFPDTILLSGDGSLWWSGGVNRGAEYAIKTLKANYLLLWNNDIIAEDSYFTTLENILMDYRNVIIGSKVYVGNNLVWSMGGTFNPYSGEKTQFGSFKNDSEEFNRIYDVDWIPGMGTLIPVEVVDKIGFWDQKNFPQYHGDSDYTYRGKLAGFELKVFPQLKIWNDVTNTGLEHKGNFKTLMKSLTSIKSYYNFKKDILFYRKYSKSLLAYKALFIKYFRLIGGFYKWKIFNFLGIKK